MEVQDRVAQLSASSIDRALRPYRTRGKRRGVSTTRPGTLLKQQIAMRTFAEWTEQQPGFFEMDLVAHCGWTGAGQFLYTLSLVDVATGWVSCAGLRDKRAQTVLAALHGVHEGLPFKILSGGSNVLVRDEGFEAMVIHLESPAFSDLTTRDQVVKILGTPSSTGIFDDKSEQIARVAIHREQIVRAGSPAATTHLSSVVLPLPPGPAIRMVARLRA